MSGPVCRVMRAMGIALVCVLVGACGDAGRASAPADSTRGNDAGPYSIVATVGMIADIAQEVAGERAEVTGLLGPGIDPHLYTPTRSDIERLLNADVILYNGLNLEGRLIESLERARASGTPVHAVAESIDESFLIEAPGYPGEHDPHVWMDPAAWTLVVDAVRDALTSYDPAGAEVYRANAEAYGEQLAELDAYAQRVLSSVPAERRVLVTAHDAFEYLGRRFGYEVVGIQGISTQSEAGVRDIEALVELLVERGVGAVFVESTINERSIRALIDGARARGHEVAVGGELFSDAMGDAGTYESTYLGMIDHNVTVIARALGGEAPERGMRGRLTR